MADYPAQVHIESMALHLMWTVVADTVKNHGEQEEPLA